MILIALYFCPNAYRPTNDVSLKFQRVKLAEQSWPTPLRWVSRAFASITLAVILLSCVILYGTIASVPVALLMRGLIYGGLGLVTAGPALLLGHLLAHGRWLTASKTPALVRWCLNVLVASAGLALAVVACLVARDQTVAHPWFVLNRATVIYRLPQIEMTELQFYSWWPMKVILGLFLTNMIWATVRRIEFTFHNLGVLTVHTGIVMVGLGSFFYGSAKIEGDTLLWRRDLGGLPVAEFYDQTRPAIFFYLGQGDAARQVMIPLPDLPRYNDYGDAEITRDLEGFEGVPGMRPLDIRLDDWPQFRAAFGPNVRARIRGFISYGQLAPAWADGAEVGEGVLSAGPAMMVAVGDAVAPRSGLAQPLVASVPGLRVVEQPRWALEFLVKPDAQRVRDLMAEFPGPHGLVVEIPARQFRAVYGIVPGQVITVGDTGYTLRIEDIGEYGLGFVTAGYQGASDTQARVLVNDGTRAFRRIVLHRYPERSQDFIPPQEGAKDPTVGPMGRRTAPDPAIRLTYIDASKTQFRLIAEGADPALPLQLLVRAPGRPPSMQSLLQPRFEVGRATPQAGAASSIWFYVTTRLTNAVQVMRPVITPKAQRQPKDEGTFLHALLPVDFEVDLPEGKTWRKRVWLEHLRYPDVAVSDEKLRESFTEGRRVAVTLPGPGLAGVPGGAQGVRVQSAFSRVAMPLPFAMLLERFEMQPYPGTQIPRDFVADLALRPIDERGQPEGTVVNEQAHLNNPIVFRRIKLSQTGWDPGDREDPQHTATTAAGRFTNQQRYSVIGVGNNVAIRVIFLGSCLIVAGIPWAFYVKPMLVRRAKQKIQRALVAV